MRFSIKIKQLDEMDRILAHKFARFLMQRAENFIILRRKPLPVRRRRAHGIPFTSFDGPPAPAPHTPAPRFSRRGTTSAS